MDSTGVFPPEYIYVATSWRNTMQPTVVRSLEDAGYGVYDFRNPNGEKGFAWSDLDFVAGKMDTPNGELDMVWDHNHSDPHQYIEALGHPKTLVGFDRDYQAMQKADIFVMVLPCERDAHLELGWAIGAGKETHILLSDPVKASLMYHMADFIHVNLDELLVTLGGER